MIVSLQLAESQKVWAARPMFYYWYSCTTRCLKFNIFNQPYAILSQATNLSQIFYERTEVSVYSKGV